MSDVPTRRGFRSGSVFALALTLCGCSKTIEGPIDGGKALEHVRQLTVTIGSRPFGSDNLEKAAAYIEGEVKKIGLTPKRQEVVDEPSGMTIKNLYVQIDGKDPQNGPILMFGAHYDSKKCEGHADAAHNFPFVGAIDGAGAPAVLIELARALTNRTPALEPNVWLYWIDAEESIDFEWNTQRSLLGSKAFVRWLAQEKIKPRVKAFVLLDLIGSADYKIDHDTKSDARLLDVFGTTAEKLGVTDRVFKYESKATDDHEPFIDSGIRSVLLIDFEKRIGRERWLEMSKGRGEPPPSDGYDQWWHTKDDTIDHMSAASLAFTGNFVYAALPALEAFVLGKK